MRIAVFLTYHNRKNKTLTCMEQLHNQKCSYNAELEFFVCDDGSTDGTSEAIIEHFPDVHIVQGTGDLFWARGMAEAVDAARGKIFDFYWMVNDDVFFWDTALDTMLASFYKKQDSMCAIVGSTKDAKTLVHTYGGLMWNGKAKPEITIPVYPTRECPECNQTNWNSFLLPTVLYQKIGKIDRYYEHSKADFDYSNRICKQGYKIYVAQDYIGFCSRNSMSNTWRDTSLTIRTRFKLLEKPNGSPWKSRWYYCKKYYGVWAVYRFMMPYLHIISSSVRNKKGR